MIQVVDDEVLEELLKEVGRALVEADVNIKVRGVLCRFGRGGVSNRETTWWWVGV